ncbi:LacI family DNA-binding transcriptional regulator [Clostridium tertium]
MSNLTIKDIAELAGVAKSTISKYLNGGSVSEETKLKIKKVIEENNYEPNAFAQSLKAKRSRFIGVIAPCLDSIVTSRVIMSIDSTLRENLYNPLILNTSHNKNLEIDNLESLSRLKVDGIILVATEITSRHKEIINKLKIPVLIIGQECKGVKSIINDDYNAGAAIGEYVASLGHEKILYLGVDEFDIAVGVKRKAGIIDKLKEHKVKDVRVEITDFTTKTSEKVAYNVLKNYDPTMVICATDNIALGVIKAMNSLGKRVKEDISLSGFGGYDVSEIITPSLTTIKFHNEEVGKIAANSIIKMIEGAEVPDIQTIGFNLIKGNSIKSMKSQV